MCEGGYKVLLLLLLAAVAAPATFAQRSGQELAVFEGVGVDEQLGQPVALDAVFLDETGQPVRIGDFLDGERPVVLNLVYHNCPMLCNLLLDNFVGTLGESAWTPGVEFDVVTVSFAPDEGPDLAARQKERYLRVLGRPAAADGWHFLTGTEDQIQQLAASVGFQFKWVEEKNEYAHPAAHIFLSPDGTITRYLFGLLLQPSDLRKALVEAGEGTVGTPLDQLALFCFQYDPNEGSYVLHAINVMKIGGLLTMLVLGATLWLFWRREGATSMAAAARNGWGTPEPLVDKG